MKKICRTIKLRRFKCLVNKEEINKLGGYEFIVCFDDNTYKWCLSKSELYRCLEQDHIKGIRYVFDVLDRMIIDRDVLIEINT